MRGRTINRFEAELAQLDTDESATTSPGYNRLLKEPRVAIAADGTRSTGRKEKELRVICQVETGTSELQRMTPSGNAPASNMRLVIHMKDLERAGLVDDEGRCTIRLNDRLVAIRNLRGRMEQRFPNPPGLYVTEVTPSGFGFGGRLNLVVVHLGDRTQGKTT